MIIWVYLRWKLTFSISRHISPLYSVYLEKKQKDVKETKQLVVSIISHTACPSPLPAGDCNIRRATGDNITLELKVGVKPGQITKWLHNSKSYVEVKDNKEHCCRGSSKYLLPNGSLQLTSLTKAKGGTYEPKVYINGQLVPGLTSVNLCVLGRYNSVASRAKWSLFSVMHLIIDTPPHPHPHPATALF